MPVKRHVWTIIAVVPFRFPISEPIGAASPRPLDGFAGTRPVATVPRRAAPFARLLVLLAAILGLAAAAAVAAADVKLAYRVVIDAPAALKTPLEQGLDLVRWQDFEYMTDDLLDRLIQEAIEQVKDVAAAQGYFSTTTDIAVQRPAAGSGLPLTLRVVVDPGPATRVTSAAVSVVGPAATDSPAGTDAAALARDGWRLRVGDVFRQAAWLEAKTVAVATVTASPYAAARITHSEARIDPDEQSAELTVVIESGPRFTFGRIEVAGLKRYPESVVRNFSDIAVGEPFSERRLDQLIRRLNTSGYFASVHAWIDPDPEQADEAPVQVRVIEARPKSLSGGISYSTDTRIRASLRYNDVDFDDQGLQFLVDARVDPKIQEASVRFTRPPTAAGYLDAVEAKIERTNIEGLVTKTAFAGVARRTLDERNMRVYRAYYYDDTEEPDNSPSIHSRALYLEYEHTWRKVDDLIAPTRGFVLATRWGGGPPGVSTESFGRIVAQYAYWLPLGRSTFLKLRAEGGAVIAATRDGVPSPLLFRTGGDTTVRGYSFESLGVKIPNATIGGRYLAIASAEVDHFLPPLWGLAAFVDAGNAGDSLSQLRPVVGYGVGLRVRSPIGPLRVDLAYGQETHDLRLHMSVGLSF
jgi:translocation and assembly module TamA